MAQPADDLELSRALFASATTRLEGAHEFCVVGQTVRSMPDTAHISIDTLAAIEAALNLIRAVKSLACKAGQ